jgi:fructokinase
MIAVIGEALIDLIIGPDGKVVASPGGGPFNVARTAGRLGLRPAFIGGLSKDGFGRMLRAALSRDGVQVAVAGSVEAPTPLAVVDLDERGVPSYRFHLAGSSAAEIDYATLAASLPRNLTAVHVGSLGLVMEPIADSVAAALEHDIAHDVLVMADPNCRPGAISDERRYRARLRRVMGRADIVKASAEDIGYLYPEASPRFAARALLADGPSLVLVTDGPRPVRALTPDGEIEVPVPDAPVVDTIGAGDSFGGAFLSWWAGRGLGAGDLHDLALVRRACAAAVQIAALTCARAGAEPPWAAELDVPGADPAGSASCSPATWPSNCGVR